MPDKSLLSVAGASPERPSRYTPIATLKWIGGLQTQRSPFASLDTRYNSIYLGGKPDSLIDGSNCEISNKLTLQRRPGVSAWSTASIPAPDFFYSWQQAGLANFVSIVDPTYSTYPQGNLQLIVDTPTNGTSAPGNIYNYSPTEAGILLNKSVLSEQTSFTTVVNTMYMGDTVDLYKLVGVNLLTYSNNFGSGTNAHSPWTIADCTLTTGQTDPTGASNASYAVFSSASTSSYIQQIVTPNYSPVSSNVFTFSIWMRANTGTPTIYLKMVDSGANVMVNTQFTLSTSWTLYQVTGTAGAGTTSVTAIIIDPSSTSAEYFLYGAQLEVGGPATPTTVTLNKPNGMYLWGIQAPTIAPTYTFTPQYGSTGAAWVPNKLYSQTSAAITAVAAVGTLATPVTLNGITYNSGAVYTASVTGGGSNGLAGRYFSCLNTSGTPLNTANQSVAPGFLCLESTGTTITLYNPGATAQASVGSTATATLLDTIVDSNGNLQVAYTPGKSGGTPPVWNPTETQATSDGLQNLIVQTASNQSNSNSSAAVFSANVTGGDTKLIFVALSNSPSAGTPGTPTITDSSGDTPTLLTSVAVSNIKILLYYVLSATSGATTITVSSGGNQATWVGIAEISNQTATDGHAVNSAQRSTNVIFNTGEVTTTNAQDILATFACFTVPNSTQGNSLGIIPAGFQGIIAQAPTQQGTGFWNMDTGFEFESATGSFNPTWTITDPTTNSNDGYMGITAAFKSSVGSLVWYNLGPEGLTSTSATNYQYAYSFVNTYTGHRSNISPFSTVTGTFAGQAINVTGYGMQTSIDPQVDAIEVYRNTDGGALWYQVPPSLMTNMSGTITDANGNVYLANPGNSNSPGTWSFTDTVLDIDLNTQIYAPIGLLNSPPPARLTNLGFYSGRLWGSVGNLLYYSTSTDNATLLNILQNGVSAESWEPTNVIPFDSEIVRIVPTSSGLIIFTTTDVWGVSGSNLSQFNPVIILANIGLGNYNSICIDGSTMMMYTRDRECLMFSLSSGIFEIGFVIGNVIEENINPLTSYLCRHIKGSQDNAFYLGDGATGWYRLNPNQYGASTMGEQTPIWSPKATVTGGCNAIASIETSPGVKTLLVGSTGGGSVLYRNLNSFSDNGTSYTWFATIGSIVLALPGLLAVAESITTEMVASESTQCAVAVLLDEISGSFETLPSSVPDPPQLSTSTSVLSKRFYLSQGTVPPVCRHMQVKLSGGAVATQDEVLAITIRGSHINEQD